MAEENSSAQNSEQGSSSSEKAAKFQKSKDEDFGYFFYPEREGAKQPSFWDGVFSGRSAGNRFKCETNVLWCVQNNPMVKLMMRALKSHGCEVSLRRHVSCENCVGSVSGGFDPVANQVVVCQNTALRRQTCCNVLAHEFLHAFDYCRANVDFENLHHLACTEIRAANMMHCSYLAALFAGDASPVNIKNRHRECVKSKALLSVLMVRNVTEEKAREVVDTVFRQMLQDLEPVGRRPRKTTRDPERALYEGQFYGIHKMTQRICPK
ncbi:mitochondrial inner membrane protease ATP23 homolog [Liolophura sinensis]|uniref:mitochondrial inner membrane protease ATP23 homolog n=1 Tax=Liolophura sinensis TaxID=3198878 RepID=UPI0031598C0A